MSKLRMFSKKISKIGSTRMPWTPAPAAPMCPACKVSQIPQQMSLKGVSNLSFMFFLGKFKFSENIFIFDCQVRVYPAEAVMAADRYAAESAPPPTHTQI